MTIVFLSMLSYPLLMSDYEAMDYVAAVIIAVAIIVIAVLIFIGHRVSENSEEAIKDDANNDGQRKDQTPNENYKPIETINVNSKPINAMNKYQNMNTAVLVRAILGDLNCQYDEDDDGSLFFVYQGERFFISMIENNVWIRVIDMRWYDCSLDNLEEISCMQKAINTANSHQICTAVYAISSEENKMVVYSRLFLPITSNFPAPDRYLAASLALFFHLKEEVVMEFEKEKQKIGLEETN